MALNLGRMRADNTGSQDTILNGIKPQKVAIPRFTGKNADELNTLAQFIEDKIASANEYGKDLTSKNVDTTLERIHTLMLKLKDASDTDNTTAYETLKLQIISQVKELMVASNSEKPKEVLLSDEDKEYIKELIAASTLTEATQKTEDQSGENGLTQDDIDKALDKTIKQQKVLNNDVVAAAEKANTITEDASSGGDDIKAELAQMFKENGSDDVIDDMSKSNATQFQKLQDLVNGHVGRLNSLFGTFGDNFKNSPLFNYKNPFAGSVGKIQDVSESLKDTFSSLNNKIHAGFDTVKQPFKTLQANLGKLKNSITSPFKKFFARKEKSKPKPKKARPLGALKTLFKLLTMRKIVNISKQSLHDIFRGVHRVVGSIIGKRFPLKKKKKRGKLGAVMAKVMPTFNMPPLSSKEKKEKKKRAGLFDSLGKFMKKINDIIKNIVSHILEILEQIIVGLCKAIAKGIGIILRAIFCNPVVALIVVSILLISIGVLLISLAVKKLVDYIVDDLGPIIKEKLKMIDPKALNRFLEKVSTFIDVFSSILAGAFAPLIVIGTLIKNAIGPLAPVIKTIAETLAKILVPVVEAIGEVVMVLLKPVLMVLKILAVGIAKILEAMMPVIQFIVDIIVGLVKNILVPIFKLVAKIIIPVIKIIGALIEGIIAIVQPIFDFLLSILMPIIQIISQIIQAVMAILQPIFDIITGVIMVILEGVKIAVGFIKKIVGFIRKIIKKIFNAIMHPVKFVMSLIKGIGNWLASFADFEIGFWKFKFKPLSFLKGLKSDKTGEGDDEEEEEEEDGSQQEIIDKLKEQIKGLNDKIKVQTKEIGKLQDKLKQAQKVPLTKAMVIGLILRTRLMTTALVSVISPALVKIADCLKRSGNEYVAEAIEEVKASSAQVVEKLALQEEKFNILNELQTTTTNLSQMLENQTTKLDILDDIKASTDKIISLLEDGLTSEEILNKLDDLNNAIKDNCSDILDELSNIKSSLKYSSKFQASTFGGGWFKNGLRTFINNAKKKVNAVKRNIKKEQPKWLKLLLNKKAKAASKPKGIFGFAKSVFNKVKAVRDQGVVNFAKKAVNKVNDNKNKLKSSFFEKFNAFKQKAKTAASKVNAVAKYTPFGFATSFASKLGKMLEKKVGNISAAANEPSKNEQSIQPEKADVKISPWSIKEWFKPVESVNNVNDDKLQNVADSFDEIKSEEVSNKNKDITNNDLKTFLTKMFENVDESFFKISKKLDEPNLLPMPMNMNITNQALLGAN